MKRSKSIALGMAVSAGIMALTSGCATYREAGRDIKDVAKKSEDLMYRGSALSGDDSAVTMDNSVYVGGTMFKVSERSELPEFMNEQTYFKKSDTVSFPEVIGLLGDQLGRRITLTSDATEYLTGINQQAQQDNDRSANRADATSFSEAFAGQGGGSDPLAILNSVAYRAGGIPGQDIVFSVDYKGTVKGLLDLLGFKSNLSWKWEDGEVVFFRKETKTFTIDALPGTNEFTAKVSSNRNTEDSSSDSGGGSSSNQSEHRTLLEYKPKGLYEEISNEISAIKSNDGVFAISEQTGTLTVTDTPKVIEKIERYINSLNAIVNKQIAIRTEVYEVTSDDSDNYALDMNLLYSGSKQWGVDLVNSGISDGAGGNSLGVTLLKPNSKFAGSKAVLNALSETGTVSLSTSNSVYTVNGQPVPVQVADELHYIKKISKQESSGEDSEPSYEVEPGMVISGFSMSILPRITSTGDIMMQFAVDISKLNGIEERAIGDQVIQLPNRSTKNFLQRVNIRSGETLMLAGFERTESENSGEGPISAKLWPLGGKIIGKKRKIQTVIVITPYIMSR